MNDVHEIRELLNTGQFELTELQEKTPEFSSTYPGGS